MIFNAKLTGNNDPIYVVQAALLGGRQANTKIPVLLAYNEVHYEGLVQDTEEDLLKTIACTEHYLSNKYTLLKKDIPIFSSLMERDEGKHLDQKLSYAQVLRKSGSDSINESKMEQNFETQKRRSSTRIADQKHRVDFTINTKRKSSSPQAQERNNQPKKAARETQKIDIKEKKRVEKKIKDKNTEIPLDNKKTKDSSVKSFTRLEELKGIKASDRTESERNELQRMRKAASRASETDAERSLRLKKDRDTTSAARSSETDEERSLRLKKRVIQLLLPELQRQKQRELNG